MLKKHGGWALGKTAPLLTKKAELRTSHPDQFVAKRKHWQIGKCARHLQENIHTSMLPDITMILLLYIYTMLIVGCLKSRTFHLGGSTHHAPHRVHLRSIAGWPRCSLVTPMTGLKQGWNDVEVMTQKTQSNGGEGVCCGKAIQMNSKCWQWKQMFRGLLASYLILDLTIEVPDSPRMKTVEAPKNTKNW